ncbi:hypothetical protein [Paenibacillus sp. Marseille-P2973]|uniref:hypothetical protein n=1 Tax=Paenibacillus sp. Marseille-P2973 TaxID=1871032 RepID=UPI001FFD3781|nr:hypothetical protein [Paenibacillus sp. Marseille-P2973]
MEKSPLHTRCTKENGVKNMIKYFYIPEYNEEYNEVILDFSVDKSLKNGYLINNSLGSDIFGDFAVIKEEVSKLLELLKGKITSYEGGGNVNLINSDKHFTIIEDIFAEEDEEDSVCKIETVEFVKIILVWARENFQYKSQRGVVIEDKGEIAINWINEQLDKISELESR